MKNLLLKRLVLSAFSIALFFTVNGQKGIEDGSKYGHGEDSIRCIRNLSLYREYVKHNDYNVALPYWKIVFDECPKSSKNIYLDGVKLYRYLLDKAQTEERKADLIDTLMIVYDRRIKYFGEKGNVLGRQGVDLLKYGRDKIEYIEQAYKYLNESIELRKIKTSQAVLGSYMSASIILFQFEKLEADIVIKDYLKVTEIIDKLIAEKPNDSNLTGLKASIDENFVKDGPGDCDKLIEFFSKEIETKRDNIEFLRMLTSLLRNRECTESALFYNSSKDLHKLAPTSESALNIAILAFTSGKYQEAANYYLQALNLEAINNKKADYYFGLAACNSELNNKVKAREYARKASSIRPDWGEPYLLIGKLYAESLDDCSSNTLPKAVYWAAVDMFMKAKMVDPSVEEKANRNILTYTAYFPNKEEAFFQDVTEGETYSIGCWINETTKARFND